MRPFAAGLVAAGAFAMLAILVPARSSAAEPFRPALDAHLKALIAQDMEALLPTLTRGEALTMITPQGERFNTRQEYIDFHRRWFANDDPKEKLAFDVQRVVESEGLSHALLQIRYTFTAPGGAVQNYTGWLTLTFALENGRWGLVFDQNTALAEGTAK